MLRGKVALVTGTSTNIGGGIAESLAAAGAALVCIDSRAENAADCARYIKSTDASAIGVTCDVTDESHVIAAISAARDSFGGIDVLVNNAAIFNKKGVVDMRSMNGGASSRSFLAAHSCSPSMSRSR